MEGSGDEAELAPVAGFNSPEDYRLLNKRLERAIAAGILTEVSVDSPYQPGADIPEKWIRRSSGHIWRLVKPDFPFRGLFRPVED